MELAKPKVRTAIQVPFENGTSGQFVSFDGLADRREHFAIVFGVVSDCPLVRVHSECITGDMFGSMRCDCGLQLREAIATLSTNGGVLIYMRQEGRGIGLYAKLEAYQLQDNGIDTYEADKMLGHPEDGRDFRPAAQILEALGISEISLITNNPEKSAALGAHGIQVRHVVPTGTHANPVNRRYLISKSNRRHTLDKSLLRPSETANND